MSSTGHEAGHDVNSRERVLTALDHNSPDRVPIDFWAVQEIFSQLITHYRVSSKDEVLDRIGADLRYIEGPLYTGPDLARYTDGSEDDIWGVARKTTSTPDGKAAYKTVVRYPLLEIKTVEEVNDYKHWPSVDWFDFSVIEEQCDEYLAGEKVVVFEGDRLNRIAQLKPYMYLRGTENAFVDMILDPGLFSAVRDRITGFYKEYLIRILESANGKIDIIMTGDDFGSQENLLLSKESWQSMLAPGFKAFMDIIKSAGAYTMHHTCGSVYHIIPEMIEMGLDILQSLQPEAAGMNGGKLKKDFGESLSFNGSMSVQKTLPFGTPEEVRGEVVKRFETLGTKGGFIIGTAHNIQADTPLENVLALIDAYGECIWYS